MGVIAGIAEMITQEAVLEDVLSQIRNTGINPMTDITKLKKISLAPHARNISGRVFFRLTAVIPVGRNKHGKAEWLFICSCGLEHVAVASAVISGNTKSCGCYEREKLLERITTHNLSGTKEFRSWAHIHQRCSNKKDKSYQYYGGRGISICKRWEKFESFLADMGIRPPNTSIERIDNNGNYTPENCRWATQSEQNRNKRNNINLTYKGETLCVGEWAERLGIGRGILYGRLRRGWLTEKTLETPA